MTSCFRFFDSSGAFEVFACGTSASYEYVGENNSGYWPGSTELVTPLLDGVAIMGDGYYYGDTYAQFEIITTFPIVYTATAGSSGNCDECKPIPVILYDCINGVCTPFNTYGTPGNYVSLATCQAACGAAACPTCEVCPSCPTCPTCPTCEVCETCPVTVCPTCETCEVCPAPTVCPTCETCPAPVTCPTCPTCPVTTCPTCPVTTCPTCPVTTCPTCPVTTCPTCPTCPACPIAASYQLFNACPTCPSCDSSGDSGSSGDPRYHSLGLGYGGYCTPCAACPTCPEITASGCPVCPENTSHCPACPVCPICAEEEVQFTSISVPIFSGNCDSSGNPVSTSQNVSVILGTEAAELLKFQELAQIKGNAYCSADVAACPDGWLIRPEYHRPQVIYQFAQIDNSGKIIGAPKYKITVPHHLSAKPDDPLPNYKRGNWEIIYVLKDNSKVTIHSFDEDTGMDLLDAIKLLIIPSYLVGGYLSKSSIVVTDTPIAEITVKNRMAKYYSSRTKNDLPDWIKKW